MSHITVILTTYDAYLKDEYSGMSALSTVDLITLNQERESLLATFPYNVLLQLSYPVMDFTDRWCWQNFGPKHGACVQVQSEYPACLPHDAHSHQGTWATNWLAKTDYNFGYNEWYFAKKADQKQFFEFVPHINCGENYPK